MQVDGGESDYSNESKSDSKTGVESDYDSNESKSKSETGAESDYDSNVSKSEDPDTIMQVDGGESDYDSDESKSESEPEEYVPKASQSRSGRQAAQSKLNFFQNLFKMTRQIEFFA